MFGHKSHLLAGLLALILSATPVFADHHKEGKHAQEEAAVLLQQIEADAIAAREHASRLKTYMLQPTLHPWQVHATELRHVKTQVNEIAELAGDFKDLKQHATKRQAKAFNALVPEATNAADAVGKAIRIVNNETTKVEIGHPDYEKTLDEIYERVDHIAAAVGFAESWSEVKEAREELGVSE